MSLSKSGESSLESSNAVHHRCTQKLRPLPAIPHSLQVPLDLWGQRSRSLLRREILYAAVEDPDELPSDPDIIWSVLPVEDNLALATSSGFPQAPRLPGFAQAVHDLQDGSRSLEVTGEVLGKLFPQRDWVDYPRKTLWRERVSTEEPTRAQTQHLAQSFDMKLTLGSCPAKGLSPLKTFIHLEAFDELIRQVAINCAERGLLLWRIREEFLMTLKTLEALSSNAITSSLQFQGIPPTPEGSLEGLDALRAEIEEKTRERTDLTIRLRVLERELRERRSLRQKQQFIKVQTIKRANHQLKDQFEAIRAFAGENKRIAAREAEEKPFTNEMTEKIQEIFKDV